MSHPFIMPPHVAGYLSVAEKKPMSLIVALAGENEIVMASDTICTVGDDEGMYKYSEEYSKIRKLKDERFAVGVAGHVFGEFPFKSNLKEHGTFSEIVEEFVERTRPEYAKGNRNFEFQYLFCGFDESGPQIETIRFFRSPYDDSPQDTGLDLSKVGKAAVGIEKHGALYWIWTFHKTSLPLETIKLLACFALKETIRHDSRVSNPIKMAVIRREQATEFLSKEEIKRIESRYETKRTQIAGILYDD